MATSTVKNGNFKGAQGGIVTGVVIPANNGQAELEIPLKQTFSGGDQYAVTASVQVYGNPSIYTPIIIRSKAYNKFYIRVKNTGTADSTVDINWVAVGV